MSPTDVRTEEQTLLHEIIPKFDDENGTELTRNIILHLKDMNELIKNVSGRGYSVVPIKWIKDESCFRLGFNTPILLMFHKSTRHGREIHKYYKPAGQQHSIPIWFLPAYNCNLNHLTLLKPHTAKNADRWSELTREMDEEFVCRKFVNYGGKKMLQSGLNFMLQYNAKPEIINDQAESITGNCFRYLYWRLPKQSIKYSSTHDMLYNSHDKLYSYRRIYKTMAKITCVKERRDVFDFRGKKITFSRGEIYVLVHEKGNIYEMKSNTAFAEPDRSRMQDGDLISCIIDKPIFPRPATPPKLIVTGLVEDPIEEGDIRHVIGLAAWKMSQMSESAEKRCVLGSSEDFHKYIQTVMNDAKTVFSTRLTHDFDRCFEDSLEKMFPLVFEDDGEIVYIPPPLMSYIICRELPVLEDKEALANLARLMDLITPGGKYMTPFKLRISDMGAKVQEGPCRNVFGNLIKELPTVAEQIHCAGIFSGM